MSRTKSVKKDKLLLAASINVANHTTFCDCTLLKTNGSKGSQSPLECIRHSSSAEFDPDSPHSLCSETVSHEEMNCSRQEYHSSSYEEEDHIAHRLQCPDSSRCHLCQLRTGYSCRTGPYLGVGKSRCNSVDSCEESMMMQYYKSDSTTSTGATGTPSSIPNSGCLDDHHSFTMEKGCGCVKLQVGGNVPTSTTPNINHHHICDDEYNLLKVNTMNLCQPLTCKWEFTSKLYRFMARFSGAFFNSSYSFSVLATN